MIQHYVLEINPEARHEWESCTLRNPITGESPDLKEAIAAAVGNRAGAYLIAVKLEVEVLEQSSDRLKHLSPQFVSSLAAS